MSFTDDFISVLISLGALSKANVLVNDKERAVITDFGLAFLIDQTEFTSSKIAGSVRTVRWSPPEVLVGPPEEGADRDVRRNVDGDPICTAPYLKKSDVYSLAMVFYEVARIFFYSIEHLSESFNTRYAPVRNLSSNRAELPSPFSRLFRVDVQLFHLSWEGTHVSGRW